MALSFVRTQRNAWLFIEIETDDYVFTFNGIRLISISRRYLVL